MAVHPEFEENGWVYAYYTYQESGGNTLNRVVRMVYGEGTVANPGQTIIEAIPGASNHNGGRIAFGPDGYLYIGTGDAQVQSLSQDTESLAGKILRVGDDGSIPDDNPIGNAVWSYGHRNVQGFTWDDAGRMWATEHGRSGLLSGLDELNLIERGKNYGWPLIEGDEEREGMETPVVHSGPTTTWAPAGAEFLNGSVYFGGLRGRTLYEVELDGERVVEIREHLVGEYGRIREVMRGPENDLYISTSNRDGRGQPQADDDRVIRLQVGNF
jgi:glucose/arabinose dehydrogenase